MDLAAKTFFRGGIGIAKDGKEFTASRPITDFHPARVCLPLAQHLGKPATPIVKRKSVVRCGDVVGKSQGSGAPIHASVSGTVLQIALKPHPTLGESQAIVIEADPKTSESYWEEVEGWRELSKEAMLEKIAAGGIVGLGGAAFPTARKLNLPADLPVDTLLINGAECEPYLTCDERLMLESPREILAGAQLIAKIVGAKKIVIGLEENKPKAAAILKGAGTRENFGPKNSAIPMEVGLCETRYPQGSERQLIESLLKRAVPPRKLPLHIGVVVQNVATAFACYHAIRFRKPLVDRVVTVSGSGICEPQNLRVPIGTLVEDIVKFCGGMRADTAKVIAGGPMMGRALGRLDVPVIKGMGGLLFLRAGEVTRETYGPCISCGRCLAACPLGLEPNQISVYTEAGLPLATEEFGTKDCFECGCCAYVCPARRPLVQFIQIAKQSFQTRSLNVNG